MKLSYLVVASIVVMTGLFRTDAHAQSVPDCAARQLRLSLGGKDGEFQGMQHSGVEVSIRNRGQDCLLPALPRIEFLDARGRPLPVSADVPVGMHPGPVMVPIRLAAGHRAATDLTWIEGPVYPTNAQLSIRFVRVQIGAGSLRIPYRDVIDIEPGKRATFGQPPLRALEGMPAG